ncbi:MULTISPECIES: hypothetical protein [Kitasatospora]|uniref:Chaplin n=1 Tax=Kitasatospora arboriphila TaxID=258052 RepID=A0ABN1TGJ6_9ACTN
MKKSLVAAVVAVALSAGAALTVVSAASAAPVGVQVVAGSDVGSDAGVVAVPNDIDWP